MANKQPNFTVTMLPCPVIEAAAAGSVDAINVVLKHYERYITALSTRTLYEDNGSPHLCVDEEMKRRLETKLITRIINFKIQTVA